MRPMDDWCLIDRDKADKKTEAKLILPDSAQEQNCRGKVVTTGPGRINSEGVRLPMAVKEGDQVMWGHYTPIGVPEGFLGDDVQGVEFGKSGKNLIFIREADLLCTVSK